MKRALHHLCLNLALLAGLQPPRLPRKQPTVFILSGREPHAVKISRRPA